jgi:hypothetical protein
VLTALEAEAAASEGAVDRRAAAASGNVGPDASSGARLPTVLEETELVDWMIEKNKALAGAYDSDVEMQIVKILQASAWPKTIDTA